MNENDFTSVYLMGFYDGEDKWKKKIKKKIDELKEYADEDNMDEFLQIGILEEVLKENTDEQ